MYSSKLKFLDFTSNQNIGQIFNTKQEDVLLCLLKKYFPKSIFLTLCHEAVPFCLMREIFEFSTTNSVFTQDDQPDANVSQPFFFLWTWELNLLMLFLNECVCELMAHQLKSDPEVKVALPLPSTLLFTVSSNKNLCIVSESVPCYGCSFLGEVKWVHRFFAVIFHFTKKSLEKKLRHRMKENKKERGMTNDL